MNTSVCYQLKINSPPKSRVNAAPYSPFVGTNEVSADLARIGGVVAGMWGQARLGRGILEEAILEQVSGTIGFTGGYFENGVAWAMSDFSLCGCFSRGAGPHMDGVEYCSSPVNPQSDMCEVEEFDLYQPPVPSIGKGIVQNLCCHGKFRGPLATYLLYIVNKPGLSMTYADCSPAPSGLGGIAVGRCGGYPGMGSWSIIFHNTNMPELMEKGEGYPASPEEIWNWIQEGKLLVEKINVSSAAMLPTGVKNGDLILQIGNGQPAWGDSLERHFELVERDLNDGFITPDVAEGIYGVIARNTNGKWEVDTSVSAAKRNEIRELRRQTSIPFKEWWHREREKVLQKEFPDPLLNQLYTDGLKWSKWQKEFTAFWQTDQDYKF
jgi:N-methylhydantoinase B/acetone carboxylase alpha subunit